MTPRPRLIYIFASILPLLVIGIRYPMVEAIALLLNLVIVGVAVGDLLLSPRPSSVRIRRSAAEVLSVGTENPVTLAAFHGGRHPLRIELSDEPPQPNRTRGLPAVLDLPPGRERSVQYRLEPRRRGPAEFGAVHLRFPSRFGLWLLGERRPLPFHARVYPNLRAVAHLELLAGRARASTEGRRSRRVRGIGGEFDRLREYRLEDEPRQIDWKSTARHGRLISREFDQERDQRIIVLLDCGRTMSQETDGVSHLDHAVNATVLLAHTALRQGDKLSVIAFSNQIERRIGPVRGRSAIHRVVRELHDVHPRQETSDYRLALEEIEAHHRKRACVILITHALDSEHLRTISAHVRPLRRTHLLLCAFLRDVALHDFAAKVPKDELEAFEIASAAELVSRQDEGLARLEQAGAFVVEIPPNKLAWIVVNRYLDIKARHLL